MKRICHNPIVALFIALAVCAAFVSGAQAQEKLKFAYIKTAIMLPFFLAEQKGYFKAEGLDLEMIPLQGGPAAAAAVASGSAHFGYSAVSPIFIARDQSQSFKFFIGLSWERTPDNLVGPIVASERSGVKSFKDLVGKTILTGPPGSLCELAWRDWLAQSGVAWSSVKVLTNPFPQHQATLEVGNADASCTPEPFFTGIKSSNVKPVVLGMGFLAAEKRRYALDGLFATDAWIAANGNTIAALKRAVAKGTKELNTDAVLRQKFLVEEFRLPPAVAAAMSLNLDLGIDVNPTEFMPVLEAMKRHGMVKPGLALADVVVGGK